MRLLSIYTFCSMYQLVLDYRIWNSTTYSEPLITHNRKIKLFTLNFHHSWVGTFISSSRKRNDIKASCNRLCSSNCNTFLFFVLLVHLSCLNSVDQIHIFFKGHGLIGLLTTLWVCCSPHMVLRIH